MLARGQVALDDLGEPRIVQEAVLEPVEERGEARDRRHGDEPAGLHDSVRLRESAHTGGALGQVVERPQQEDGVRRGVRHVELLRVAEHRLEPASRARLLHVQGHRVDQAHFVAALGEPRRVLAGPAADVEDDRGRRREVTLEHLLRPRELELRAAARKAVSLDARRVVSVDRLVHRSSVAPDVDSGPAVRILLVSQMYPGPDDPDLGTFVAQMEDALAARGHEVERAVLDRRAGGRRRYLGLAWSARSAARRFRPEVVYSHFLVPAGLIAELASDAPLVATAHGRDVRNVGAIPGMRAATRLLAHRAAALVAVSDYLRRELEAKVPEARGKTHVVDSGVDLERFRPADAVEARRELDWEGEGPGFLCLGALSERKNVVRLARAFERLGRGRLAFVGDGPLRPALEGRPGITLAGRVPHDVVPRWLAAADVVCQPSLVEPLGQAVLEAMACARPVVATRIGGPPEFVPPEAGVLVDPLDEDALVAALDAASRLPVPNEAARAAAAGHDVREQARRVEEILLRAARDRRA